MDETEIYDLFKCCRTGLIKDTRRINVANTPSNTTALGMLARISSNISALDSLYKSQMAVEAETILRSAMETAFWLGGVARKPGFIDDIERDDIYDDAERRKRSRAAELLKSGDFADVDAKQVAELRRAGSGPKTKAIDLETLLDSVNLRSWYALYQQLSDTAAHPSMNSLSRHLAETPDGTVMVRMRDLNSDWRSTLLLACEVTLLTKMLRDEIFPPDSEDWSSPIHDRVLTASEALH